MPVPEDRGDRANRAQLGRHLLARVRSRVKHQRSRLKEIFDVLRRTKDRRGNFGVLAASNVVMAAFDDVLAASDDVLEAYDGKKMPMYNR